MIKIIFQGIMPAMLELTIKILEYGWDLDAITIQFLTITPMITILMEYH